jgi:hypothetical protein
MIKLLNMGNSKQGTRPQSKSAWEHMSEWMSDNFGGGAQAAQPMDPAYKQKVKSDLNETFRLNLTPAEIEEERRKAREFQQR